MAERNETGAAAAIAGRFAIDGQVVAAERYGAGHINDTFRLSTDTGTRFILQRINRHVFRDPAAVMDNIERVTAHLAAAGLDGRERLSLVPTHDGGSHLVDGDGEVILVSMAPNNETSGLRTALAMGAASATIVSDDALQGSDALGTAKVLAAAIARQSPDLVLAATESSDGYTGTVPEQIAELMNLPSVTFAKSVAVDGGTAKVQRQTEAGYDEVECPLPALVSVTAGVVEPRYPSFKGIMAAKSKPVDELDLAGVGVDAGQVGWAGAGQEIVSIADAPTREAGDVIEDEGDAYERIVAFLDELKVL